jgi:hypothetical protein
MKKTMIMIALFTFVSVMAFAGNSPAKFGLPTNEISTIETSYSTNNALLGSTYTDNSDGFGYMSLATDNSDVYLWAETAPYNDNYPTTYSEVNLSFRGTTYTDISTNSTHPIAHVQIITTGFMG